MSQIGCLGDIIFSVSSEEIKTINNVVWSGSVRYAEHQRHLFHGMAEYLGMDLDKFSFDIQLLAANGVNVMDELVRLWRYQRDGETLPLAIGERPYGKYRWVIQRHRIRMQIFDPDGNLIGATVNLNLIEYLNV